MPGLQFDWVDGHAFQSSSAHPPPRLFEIFKRQWFPTAETQQGKSVSIFKHIIGCCGILDHVKDGLLTDTLV